MMRPRRVLITGGTGLIGAYLLDRLLDHPEITPVLLVRAPHPAAAAARLRAVLAYFGRADLGRAELLCGDVTAPRLGLDAAAAARLRATVTDIVHSAASLDFDHTATPGEHPNLTGTRHVLELAAPGVRLFHVSTAYVAGLHPGVFREADLDVGQPLRNSYERSKFQAEQLVRAHFAGRERELTVLRPAIVTGEYRSGRTFQFFGLYQVLQLLELFARRHPGGAFHLPFAPDSTQNYIPIDRLTAMITEIFLEPRHHGRTYHLVNPNPLPNTTMQRLLEQRLGLRIVDGLPGSDAPPANRRALERAARHFDYLLFEPRFTCGNCAQLAAAQAEMTFDAAYLERLLAHCHHSGWGKLLPYRR